MAAKKDKAEAAASGGDEFDEGAAKRRASKADMDAQAKRIGQEREAAAAEREALAQGQINQAKAVKPNPNGNIDQRMAALLRDHEAMGAR